MTTLIRTVRHLRLSQLWWRARYALERKRRFGAQHAARWQWRREQPPKVSTEPIPDPYYDNQPPSAASHDTLNQLRRGIFQHLNRSQELGRETPNWLLGPIDSERLWAITLHYQAWAYELATLAGAEQNAEEEEAAALFRHYVGDWIARCPCEAPGARHLAWNSYAIATRIGWWVRAYQRLGQDQWRRWGNFEDTFLQSLWQQAAYLYDHLEWDLLGNHLLRDAVGLAWAGRFFAEQEANRWLNTATQIAVEQAREQVLADGGHFERSPHYHLQIMEDLLTLSELVKVRAARATLRDTWQRMADQAAWMRHPDGNIPLFNDSSLTSEDSAERLAAVASNCDLKADFVRRLGGHHLEDTGMVVWHGTPWSVFFDVGQVGPDYQPGHAHADTLTLECSVAGERLFVDPGTFGYDNDANRRYDRSTAAHNTVCINGQDSSEVWHIFRVGRRAIPCDVQVAISSHGLKAQASHTGYDHLPGKPRHTRAIEANATNRLLIHDRITGRGRHAVTGGYLLAPGWSACRTDDGWLLNKDAVRVRITVTSSSELEHLLERRPYHPQYGFEVETNRLSWKADGPLPLDVTFVVELV